MWYVITFIAGSVFGVVIMALMKTAGRVDKEWNLNE